VNLVPAVPIDRTYALYELWCYIKLLHACGELFPDAVSDIRNLLMGLEGPDLLGVRLAQGQSSRIQLRTNLSLTYQRRFCSIPDAEGGKTTLIEAVPDVTLAKTDPTGQLTGAVLFDPKYRVGQSLLDGVRDLHVYRDAIESGDARIVRGAAAISPRPGQLADPVQIRPDRPSIVRAAPEEHDFKKLLQVSELALQ
jgi:hypothetical protein